MGELHLEIIVDRLLREFKVKLMLERLKLHTKKHLLNLLMLKVSMLNSQVVKVNTDTVRLNLNQWILTVKKYSKFDSTVVGGSIPKEYIPAVGAGIEEATRAGILGGFRFLVFMQLFGTDHITKSTLHEMAFK